MFYKTYQYVCRQKGMSPSAVAVAVGLTRSAVNRWKNGSVPQERTIRDIADYLGVPVQMFYDEDEIPKINTDKKTEVSNAVNLRMIPVYESVSAGFGTLARDVIVDRVPCVIRSEAEADETIGIIVHGDSMYPKIEDGDTIVVHKQTSVDSGALAVVMVDGDEGFVKRVEYGSDWIHLISINPMYPTMKFKNEDVLRVEVVGRVVKIIKDI